MFAYYDSFPFRYSDEEDAIQADGSKCQNLSAWSNACKLSSPCRAEAEFWEADFSFDGREVCGAQWKHGQIEQDVFVQSLAQSPHSHCRKPQAEYHLGVKLAIKGKRPIPLTK